MEEIFLLMCYLGFSYNDARSLPIQYRGWFIGRINSEIEKQSASGENSAVQPSFNNTPDVRAMMGKPSGRRKF